VAILALLLLHAGAPTRAAFLRPLRNPPRRSPHDLSDDPLAQPPPLRLAIRRVLDLELDVSVETPVGQHVRRRLLQLLPRPSHITADEVLGEIGEIVAAAAATAKELSSGDAYFFAVTASASGLSTFVIAAVSVP